MARNDAIFRQANERIESFVQSMDGDIAGPLPFLCECADEYEAVRQDSVRFMTVPGHEGTESWVKVVDRNERFAVVEKLGAAAEVATGLDARSKT